MKTIFFYIAFFQVAILFSQPPEENKVINTLFNSNTANPIIVMDSIQIENLNEVEIISTKKSSKNKEDISNSKQEFKSISTTSDKFIQKKKVASNQSRSRSADAPLQEKMDEDVSLLKLESPNSFEYYLFYYMSGNYNVDREKELKLAEAMKPLDPDILTQCLANAIVKEDKTSALAYLKKIKENKLLSNESISYAADLLESSTDNQALITHGFLDSYGVAYQQIVQGIHPEIKLISLDLLQSETYRNGLAQAGYILPSETVINTDYLSSFCSLNNDKKLALSMTIPKDYLLPIQSFLFPVGLVFEYRQDNSISETSLVARNEQLWNTSLEKQNLYQYKSMESNNLSSNYLPMLLFLKSSYLLSNEADKLIHIDKEIGTIAEKSGKVSFIKKH